MIPIVAQRLVKTNIHLVLQVLSITIAYSSVMALGTIIPGQSLRRWALRERDPAFQPIQKSQIIHYLSRIWTQLNI